MPLRLPLPQPKAELSLSFARGILALALAVVIGFSSDLHLNGMMGTLGMYAVTDGVLAALFPSRRARSFLWSEAAVSVVLGLAMMVALPGDRALLFLFCVRNLCTASAEVLEARSLDRGGWLKPHNPHAYLAYAGLSSMFLSVAFMITGAFAYGALELHACLAGQLGIWATLVVTYVLRARKTGLPDGGALANGRHSTV
jgi:hypothetical protein